jgi:hypothetical protein
MPPAVSKPKEYDATSKINKSFNFSSILSPYAKKAA